MTERIPELRERFLYKRWFLNRRTAEFDLALAGAAYALARRRPGALLAALPYAKRVRTRGGAQVRVADVAADVVGFAALVAGSVSSRTPVL